MLLVAFCLSYHSAVFNRKKKISLAAGAWVLLSAIVLSVIGWGTKENGLILYALYFGWAYLVLLFQLIVNACEKLKISFGVVAISIIIIVILLIYNIPGVRNMLQFAFQYYPL